MDDLESSHTPAAIRERLRQGPRHSYLRDFVYGAVDGAVTTFAVVSGVKGAELSSAVVIILGTANLLGDGFSMAAGNFLATKATLGLREKAWKTEAAHIEKIPEGEREEIRQIFAAKGFTGQTLESVVEVITSNRDRWINTMLQEEMGMPLEGSSPWKAALSTFAAFVGFGLLPLLAYLGQWLFPAWAFDPFIASAGITAAAFFALGALKGRYLEQTWYHGGFETLLVGGCAATLAFWVGLLLRNFAA